YVNLGRMLQSVGRNEAAAAVFVEAQTRGLDAGVFGHLLAAARGAGAAADTLAPSARAPEAYVRQTFDAFAQGFEQRLVGELGYDVPQRLVALALRDWKPGAAPDVLDL